ncbi:hypothetical protein Ancab_032167 [Ancistrocladus abbreviatus]
MLDEYLSLKEQKVTLDQEKCQPEQEKYKVRRVPWMLIIRQQPARNTIAHCPVVCQGEINFTGRGYFMDQGMVTLGLARTCLGIQHLQKSVQKMGQWQYLSWVWLGYSFMEITGLLNMKLQSIGADAQVMQLPSLYLSTTMTFSSLVDQKKA